HGFVVWFDTLVADGLEISSAPGALNSSKSYGTVFFPWAESVGLSEGDSVRVSLKANLVGGDYIWRWETVVHSRNTETPAAVFTQSTFLNDPEAASIVKRRAADYVPQLNDLGDVDALVLEMMRRRVSLGEIASALAAAHPEDFTTTEEALGRVRRLAV